MVEISKRSVMILAHIASRGIGLSLMSDKNGWISDQTLARTVLRDAGYSEKQVSDLAYSCRGIDEPYPRHEDVPDPVGGSRDPA